MTQKGLVKYTKRINEDCILGRIPINVSVGEWNSQDVEIIKTKIKAIVCCFIIHFRKDVIR